jgi:hypothetical protein
LAAHEGIGDVTGGRKLATVCFNSAGRKRLSHVVSDARRSSVLKREGRDVLRVRKPVYADDLSFDTEAFRVG